jgi:phospholipid/cholesterol/gamma-HCH transport system permease protein
MSLTAAGRPSFFVEAVGVRAIAWARALRDALGFLGRIALAVPGALRRANRLRSRELALALQEAGIDTLPLVAVVSFATGAVLALVGVPPLDRVGALLVAPNLIAIVILREMGALMTGICLAGRLGSASAAEIATHVSMTHPPGTKADVLEAFDELVLPRVFAFAVMAPLLVVYANATGLLGSVAVGVGLLGIPQADYVDRTLAAFRATHAVAGVLKGVGFGIVVALAGTYHGLRSGAGPVAVGRAVRRGVVTAVMLVVVVDVALTLFFQWARF